MLRHSKWALAGGALIALQGCGIIYKTTGDVLVSFGRSEMLPYMMTYDDTRMACITGESLTPLLMSFERVGSKPDKLGTMVFTVAATCSDQVALDAELRYMRALNEGRTDEAQDARIEQKRWAAVSAQRQLTAFQRMDGVFGSVGDDGKCPNLKTDFDEMVWMVGNLSGVQALLNDAAADGQVGVPRDIAAKVERNMKCLDNEKWWGVPRGTRAAIWNLLPMNAPANADVWGELERSADLGIKNGVRLGSALYAMSAFSQGDEEKMKTAIRQFGKGDTVNEDYLLLDTISQFMISGISDRLWTENTGRRTPIGGLGTFWDDRSSQPAINIDDLL